jgi:hypothetical protein
MQASSDIYVRWLRDWKFSMPIEIMVPCGMPIYGELCGGGRWPGRKPAPGTGSPSRLPRRLRRVRPDHYRFAACAGQNEGGCDSLADAVASGRITAEPGM